MSLPPSLPLPTPTTGKSKLEDSDEDLFTVPDVEAMRDEEESTKTGSQGSLQSSSKNNNNNNNNGCSNNNNGDGGGGGGGGLPPKRRRGRNPIDKEYRRLKRLLRNRVSAQQARERKKVYVNELESKANELVENNSKLEEKISTLVNENTMLRKILLNTRAKADENEDAKRS